MPGRIKLKMKKDELRIFGISPREWPSVSPDLAVMDFAVWPWMQARVSF
jgi:hypothetical protein